MFRSMLVSKAQAVPAPPMSSSQRVCLVLSPLFLLAQLTMMVVYLKMYRASFDWTFPGHHGEPLYVNEKVHREGEGITGQLNTTMLVMSLSIIFHSMALLGYRVAAGRVSWWANAAWYVLWNSVAGSTWLMALVGWIYSSPEVRFWSVPHWIFASSLGIFLIHYFCSFWRSVRHSKNPVTVDEWAEHSSSHSQPQLHESHLNHAEHEVQGWLLWRAQWAVLSYVCLCFSVILLLTSIQAVLATGHLTWAQNTPYLPEQRLNETSPEARIQGALCLLILLASLTTAYAAAPLQGRSAVAADWKNAGAVQMTDAMA